MILKNFKKIKIMLLKLKHALAKESIDNKKMLNIYRKASIGQHVSNEELDWAKNQFKESLKVVGLGFLVFLPFSPITLPFCIKLGKVFGVDIIPKNFKDLK